MYCTVGGNLKQYSKSAVSGAGFEMRRYNNAGLEGNNSYVWIKKTTERRKKQDGAHKRHHRKKLDRCAGWFFVGFKKQEAGDAVSLQPRD